MPINTPADDLLTLLCVAVVSFAIGWMASKSTGWRR